MIKKLFIFIILLACTTTFAKDNICSPDNTSKSPKGVLLSVTGVNFLTRKIVKHEIESAIEKKTGAKLDIKIKSSFGSYIKNCSVFGYSTKITQEQYVTMLSSNKYASFVHKTLKNTNINYLKRINMLNNKSLDFKLDDGTPAQLIVKDAKQENENIFLDGYIVIFKNLL